MEDYVVKKMTSIDKVSILLIFAGILPAVFPMITVFVPNIMLSNVGFFGWFVLNFIDKRHNKYMFSVKNIFPIIFMFIMYFIANAFENKIYGNRYWNLSIFYFGPIIYNFYRSENREYIFKYVFMLLAPFVLFTALKTGTALATNPYIARSIKSGDESFATLRKGIGGYAFIYFMVALAPVFLYVSVEEKKLSRKALFLGMFLGCAAITILSNYFTALLTLVLSSSIVLIMRSLKKGSVFMAIMLVVIVIFLLFSGEEFYNGFIDFLTNLAGGKTADRLTTMRGSLFKGLMEEFMGDRAATLGYSWNAFKEHFFLGMVADTASGYLELAKLGQHSHILDTMAIWGVLWGSINIKILFSPFNRKKRSKNAAFTAAMLVVTIIIFGFNNAVNSVAFVISIVYPFVTDYYNKERQLSEPNPVT